MQSVISVSYLVEHHNYTHHMGQVRVWEWRDPKTSPVLPLYFTPAFIISQVPLLLLLLFGKEGQVTGTNL